MVPEPQRRSMSSASSTPANNTGITTANTPFPAPNTNQLTLPTPSLTQPLSIKLDETNLLLWKNQLLNVIIANRLEDFIDPDLAHPTQIHGQYSAAD